MSDPKTNRTKRLQVRVTPTEFQIISDRFSKSTKRKLSDYLRSKLMDKPIAIYQRNKSLDDFMAEMIVLRNELNALGNNYNQVVKRLHTLQHVGEIKGWLLLHENTQQILLVKVGEIKSKITQINDEWLQS